MRRPLWTILIPTIGRRRHKFVKLAEHLLDQAGDYNEPAVDRPVTVLAYYNQGERPLSAVRQALVTYADSVYVSFVDDDDWVPDDFVRRVVDVICRYPAVPVTRASDLAGWVMPDQVGWRMQHYSDGVPSKPTYHSLEYQGWWDDDHGYYRDVSHLNPVRRALALRADFQLGDPPEDTSWADQMRGLVKTEACVDFGTVMYHYYATGDSTWRPGSVSHDGGVRPVVDHPLFDWHPESTT